MSRQDILDTLEGMEIWSIRYEGLVTVTDGKIVTDTRRFTPTAQEAQDLLEEAIYQEYGTTNMETIARMEGF